MNARRSFLFQSLAGVVATFSAAGVQACKPLMHVPSDYTQHRVANAVVFRGRVTAVGPDHRQGNVIRKTLSFSVTRWWTSPRGRAVKVQGITGNFKGTDCEGIFDFSAQVGEEWLIFGQRSHGLVTPDNLLSQKILDGVIPAEMLKALG